MKYGIFYGTTTGMTEDVANKLASYLDDVEIFDVANGVDEMENCEFIFALTPTYGRGEIEEHWEFVIDDILDMDLSGKKVAILSTGDCDGHSTSFVNTIKTMYDIFKETEAEIVGKVSIEGYSFDESTAIENGMFLGLPIDEMTEADKTDERIKKWLEGIL